MALLACGIAAQPAEAKDRFVVDLASEPSTLDPQQQWNPDSYYVYRNIFDNLVTRNDQGEIVPQVALSWTYRSDTEIDFRIRDDITFHDGRRLTPEDVAFSIRRITDPKFASPQLGQFSKIVAAEVVGTDTVRLRTNGPYPALLAQLVKLSIVPKHVVEAVGNDAFNLAPVGSGPYRFQQWQRGVAVTLARNDAYWGPRGPSPPPSSAPCRMPPRASPMCRPAPPISSCRSIPTRPAQLQVLQPRPAPERADRARRLSAR
jgi:peptide/nickel transport system substrate-binding protein